MHKNVDGQMTWKTIVAIGFFLLLLSPTGFLLLQ